MRVGQTVCRPTSAASSLVRTLLDHLEAVGFDGAPRHLGVDAKGRDVFDFLPGEVPTKVRPMSDEQVAAGARLLRRFHDATRSLSIVAPGQVMCHHDPGPNNAVFRDGLPVAFIDFDMVAPGDHIEDLGYMGWLWCISSKATAPDMASQASKLSLLADAYDLDWRRRARLIDAVLDRQYSNADFWRARELDRSIPDLPVSKIHERIEWSYGEAAFTAQNRTVFEASLGITHQIV